MVLSQARIRNLDRLPRREKSDIRTRFSLFLLYGYFFIGKAFVYISFPLALFFSLDRKLVFDRIYNALTRPGELSGLTWTLLVSTIYGIVGVVYGLVSGYSPVTTIEVFAFILCPWFLYFGVYAGEHQPGAVRNYVRFMAWFHAISTPLYYVVLRNVPFFGGDEGIFQPGSGALVLIGLFCFERNLGKYWFPILVCSFDTIAAEIRADWLGLGIAVAIWAVAAKQVGRVVAMTGVLVAFLAIGFAADVRIPALPGRGGEISARDTVGRALSSIDPELAHEYSSNSQTYAGTVKWRETWWRAIRDLVFDKPTTTVFGLGFGYPIKDLVSYLGNSDIRSPHSVFYFTLAYSGLLGFCVFAALQLNLLLLFWRTFRKTGQIFGFVSLIFLLIGSFFGNFFEAPQRSVPPYIMWGMCLGSLVSVERRRAPSPGVTGRGFPRFLSVPYRSVVPSVKRPLQIG